MICAKVTLTCDFLPAAKRQGHAELWVEKKEESYGFLAIELLFIVSFGMFLSCFEFL